MSLRFAQASGSGLVPVARVLQRGWPKTVARPQHAHRCDDPERDNRGEGEQDDGRSPSVVRGTPRSRPLKSIAAVDSPSTLHEAQRRRRACACRPYPATPVDPPRQTRSAHGFAALKRRLEELAARYDKPVLLLQGDPHTYRTDQR
jgi:hypothetical protein